MELRAGEIANLCGGRLRSGDPEHRFTVISFDSRRVTKGSLFAAIPGERVDGHDFVASALAAGASGALVMRPVALGGADPAAVVIEVADTTRALQDLASDWRKRLTARVIGVAGSNGKTSTKDTLAAVLGEAGPTWATPGNENSQIGAPLAVLGAPLDSEFVVLELGTSAPGELERLAKMARPDHAVVTAAFAEHLEWLGSIAGVIEAETEILDGLPAGGIALIGSAEPGLVAAARRRSHVGVRALGLRGEDDWRLDDIRLGRGGTTFTLARADAPTGTSERRTWHTPLLGAPAAWAGGFAAALATELGVDPETIQRGLDRVRPAAHRLVAREARGGALLILDDCYNSNPASCIAALDSAEALAGNDERLVLVVGDMLELGEASEAAHREVGEAIAQRASRVDLLVAVGPESRRIADAGVAAGIATRAVAGADEALAAVEAELADGRPTVLLAKASRGIGLDRLVAAIAD
ncbi:MAG: UDP-N-acetylmuramoyl-tripeptide--D-alanyl-D-alanine ligase [Deltaproteobacteria bacterium]|nr:UDP-N-acetylmuramoyl-tripeptide--D-alanyl-D-alanine ligase [Deltaproteobacteria bacterium]